MLIFFGLGNIIDYDLFLLLFIMFLDNTLLSGWWWWCVRLNDFITETFDTFDITLSLCKLLVHVNGGRNAQNNSYNSQSLSIERDHTFV